MGRMNQPTTPSAQVWQLAQDVQSAYRAALKPPLILPSGLQGWLMDRRAKTIE